MIKKEIKESIEKDIERIKNNLFPAGSSELYTELKCKYLMIDQHFMDGIIDREIVHLPGRFVAPDFVNELRAILSKLETYLLLDQIPVIYEKTGSASEVNITTKKFVNKGNIGKGNSQKKEKVVNENGTKTTSWFKNLFTWRRK